jgi:hypothetical protein
MNIDKYLKLLFLNYRFREFHSSKFKHRNGKSPLELAGCVNVPYNYHWIEKHLHN